MPDLWYADDQIALHHGDALDVARELPDGAADCIVTSPPYYQMRDYQTPGQYGLEASPAEYVETMRTLFAELRRVLADDGTCWINLGDSYNSAPGPQNDQNIHARINGSDDPKRSALGAARGQPRGATYLAPKNLLGIPWQVAFALQDDGWILRNAIIWNKPNAMPESVTDRLSGRYEHVFLFTKKRAYWFDLDPIREPITNPHGDHAGNYTRSNPEVAKTHGWQVHSGLTGNGHANGRNPGDVWEIPTQPFSAAHFAVMPQQLAQRCIQAGCTPRRCQECGHAPNPIVEYGNNNAESAATDADRDFGVGSGRKDWDRAHTGPKRGAAGGRSLPVRERTTTGHTDCGHNAYRAGTVLDPFSGSGTTGLAAQRLGRKYIGIDLNPEYLNLSLKTRLLNATLDFSEAADA